MALYIELLYHPTKVWSRRILHVTEKTEHRICSNLPPWRSATKKKRGQYQIAGWRGKKLLLTWNGGPAQGTGKSNVWHTPQRALSLIHFEKWSFPCRNMGTKVQTQVGSRGGSNTGCRGMLFLFWLQLLLQLLWKKELQFPSDSPGLPPSPSVLFIYSCLKVPPCPVPYTQTSPIFGTNSVV